jgi:hypothetical protein
MEVIIMPKLFTKDSDYGAESVALKPVEIGLCPITSVFLRMSAQGLLKPGGIQMKLRGTDWKPNQEKDEKRRKTVMIDSKISSEDNSGAENRVVTYIPFPVELPSKEPAFNPDEESADEQAEKLFQLPWGETWTNDSQSDKNQLGSNNVEGYGPYPAMRD